MKFTTCHKELQSQPFRTGDNDLFYCSIDCLPEGTLDEPYALTYVGIFQQLTELTCRPQEFEHTTDLDSYLNEINELAGHCTEYALGQDGIHFFKDEIARLHEEIVSLHDATSAYFTDLENYQLSDSLYIEWSCLEQDAAIALEAVLTQVLEKEQWQPEILYAGYLEAHLGCSNTLTFCGSPGEEDVELNKLSEVIGHFLKNHPHASEFAADEVTWRMQLAICPICTCLEPFEDFQMNEDYQAYACSVCSQQEKRRFPDWAKRYGSFLTVVYVTSSSKRRKPRTHNWQRSIECELNSSRK